MDLSSKIILAALALGIWVNAAMMLRPTPAQAQGDALASIASNIDDIARGICTSHKLC